MLGVEPLDPQVTEFLSGVSTATLTAELFTHGLRNTFLSGVRSLNPAAARFVGDAFTLRYIPAREDLDVVDGFADPEHPQRRAIENLSSGQVLVVDCRGDMGAGALCSRGRSLSVCGPPERSAADHILTTDSRELVGTSRDGPRGRFRETPGQRRRTGRIRGSLVDGTSDAVGAH